MARARVKGAAKVRRMFRAMPDTMRAELAHVMQDVAPKIARQMEARAPVRTGALRAGIKWKVSARTLKMQVGLLGTKRGRAKLFYGYILNFGRKAKTVLAKRRRKDGTVSRYSMRVRAIAPQHFVTGRMPDLRSALNSRLRDVWDRALQKAAAGAGNE
jgi:hypothetical protein